ncbi:RPA family protein [Haloplanus litoreus]|uniref:RPA family protein n=1 Tax=Haloplanus litoreus TaxID=767515 RepID=A0ABD5ZXD5_9EURY
MSADDSGPGRREVAHRLFAAEFDDATVSYAESDEERAPKYVVTPTGARVNRLFAVGVLTEVESVNEDVLRARVVDPTGAFVSYAGQYQPDAAAFFERAEPPAFVALTGKARTFEPDDGNRIYTSVRPESVADVDSETRDRWTVSAAEATLRRIAAMADAKSLDVEGDALEAALLDRGYDVSLATGIPIALERYGTTTAYLDALREVALDALEVVAGDRDAVRSLDRAPADAGTAALGPLPAAVTDDGAAASEATATATDDETTAAAPADTAGATPSAGTAASESDSENSSTAETVDDQSPVVSDDGSAADAAATTADSAAAASEDAADDLGEFDDSGDDLGEFDDSGDDLGEFDDSGDDLGEFDDSGDDLYELGDEERREVEESFDVGFESAAEVDDPGEADIDVPGPEDLAEAEDTAGERAVDEETAAEADAGEAATDEGDAAADVDLEAVAVDAMSDLDDGDGADREAVVAAVVEEYGADPGDVADAIEDALMSGKCYEPSEDSLKAI